MQSAQRLPSLTVGCRESSALLTAECNEPSAPLPSRQGAERPAPPSLNVDDLGQLLDPVQQHVPLLDAVLVQRVLGIRPAWTVGHTTGEKGSR